MSEELQLFVTCLIDSLFPEVGESTLEILSRAGAKIHFPKGQTCCGQPAYNAGFHKEARKMAQRTIEVLSKANGPIVIPSGSCTAMIRQGYKELFVNDPYWYSRATELARRTFELTEFLVDQLGITTVDVEFNGNIAYHPSCHLLHDLHIDQQPLILLESIHQAQIHELSAECCGFGGVFAVEFSGISTEMLKRRIVKILESGADIVTGCDVSCLMHIEGGLRRKSSNLRCVHIAQILNGDSNGLR